MLCLHYTCVRCKKRGHDINSQCDDSERKEVITLGKKRGWKHCYRCKNLLEIIKGCRHITCPCGAEFCYVCCKPFKQCKTEFQCSQKHTELAEERARQEEEDRVETVAIRTAEESAIPTNGTATATATEHTDPEWQQTQHAVQLSREDTDLVRIENQQINYRHDLAAAEIWSRQDHIAQRVLLPRRPVIEAAHQETITLHDISVYFDMSSTR